jgi:hypothetical protein
MRAGTVISSALCGLLCLHAPAAAQERFTLSGERVAVYNLAGQMRVEAGSGSEVQVLVTRAGSDGSRLSVRRGERDGANYLAVVYPSGDVVYPAGGRGGLSRVTVRNDGTFGGDMSLLSGSSHTVSIRGSGRGAQAWADVVVQVPAGARITVHNASGRIDIRNVNAQLAVRAHNAAIHATATRGGLDLDNGSGGVVVNDAEGEVRIDTGSGGVEVTGVRGGLLDIDTGSGGVTGHDLAVQRLHVDVGSGGVRLDGIDARNLEVDTGSGAVRLGLSADAEYVNIDTGSGGVLLALPRSFGADAEIDTGSGGIRVEVPAAVRRSSRTHFSGRFGDGNGRMVIDTGSGGVQIIPGS